MIEIGTEIQMTSQDLGHGLFIPRTTVASDVKPAALGAQVDLGDDNLTYVQITDNGEQVYERHFNGESYFFGSASLYLDEGEDHDVTVLARDADGNESYA